MARVLEGEHYDSGSHSVLPLNMSFRMTATEPRVADDGRYSVTQTCEALGIHRNTLERYRKKQQIRCGWRMTTGRKYYTGIEIKRLWRKL